MTEFRTGECTTCLHRTPFLRNATEFPELTTQTITDNAAVSPPEDTTKLLQDESERKNRGLRTGTESFT